MPLKTLILADAVLWSEHLDVATWPAGYGLWNLRIICHHWSSMSSSEKWGHHLPLRIKWNKWQRVFVNRNLSDKFWLHDFFFLNIHPFQVNHWVLVNLQLCGQHPIHSDHPHHSTAPACLFAGDGLLALGQGSHWSAFCLCSSASSRNFIQTESDNTWHFAFGFLASAQCGSGPSSLCVHQVCPYGWISLYG